MSVLYTLPAVLELIVHAPKSNKLIPWLNRKLVPWLNRQQDLFIGRSHRSPQSVVF